MLSAFSSQAILLAGMAVATIFVGTYLWLKPKNPR